MSRGTIETQVPQYFQVIDDNIFERVQSFALVAKLGPDVPEEFACFTTGFNDRECQGRIGATEIKIRDTDGKHLEIYNPVQNMSVDGFHSSWVVFHPIHLL